MGERLSASEPRISRRNRTAHREYLAVAFEHHECSVLIRKPAECGKRNHAIGADNHKTLQPMCHAREPDFASVRTDAIFQEQVSAILRHTDPVTPKRDDT